MAYELPWVFGYNTAPVDNSAVNALVRSFAYQLKNFLVANAGYTVVLSSNSVSVSASDLWTSLANVVSSSSAHSWIVLKSPEGMFAGADGTGTGNQSRYYLLIDLNISSNTTLNIYCDLTAYTGGSTTAKPIGSASEIRLTSANISVIDSTTAHAFHFVAEPGGSFAARTIKTASGGHGFNLRIISCLDVPTIASSGKLYPYAINIFCKSWASSSFDDVTSVRSATYNSGWDKDGIPVANQLYALASDTGVIGEGTSGTGNVINGYNDDSYLMVGTSTTNKRAIIGRLPDMRLTGATLGAGTVDNAVTPEFAVFGATWFPADVVPSF